MDQRDVNLAAEALKKCNGKGYDYLINKVYLENGISGLYDLELMLLAEDVNKKVMDYLELKIKEHNDEEEIKRLQIKLDLKSKKRQVFWFYPVLIGGFIGGLFGIISILATLKVIDLSRFELKKESEKANTTLILSQTKKGDSMHSTTTLVQDSTSRGKKRDPSLVNKTK